MVEVRLVANRTFVPALEPGAKSNDTRELGVRVFHAFVQPSLEGPEPKLIGQGELRRGPGTYRRSCCAF